MENPLQEPLYTKTQMIEAMTYIKFWTSVGYDVNFEDLVVYFEEIDKKNVENG